LGSVFEDRMICEYYLGRWKIACRIPVDRYKPFHIFVGIREIVIEHQCYMKGQRKGKQRNRLLLSLEVKEIKSK